MSNADFRGRFVWHELLTTDTRAAAAFYPKVTAWKTQAWDKDPSYTLWVGSKGPFGGVRTLPDAARASGPAWLAYVGTPDVDATVQSAQGLGARVLMGATDIPETGRFAVLADPQGAAFALYSPGPSSQDGGGSMPQEFSWHELMTTDVAAALRFYTELFGWQEVGKHDMGPMGVYHLVGIHGVQSIGMFKIPPDRPMPTAWMCYAHVADVDKAANGAKAAGGKIMNGPMQVPGGTWIAHLSDPQGAAFAVHADKRVAAATPAAQPAKVAPPKSAATPPAAKSQPPTVRPTAPAAPSPAPSRPAAPPPVSAAAAKAPAPARKPAAAKKAAVKKAPAKKSAKKRAAKKASAKKRPLRRAKRAAKKAVRKAVKRRGAKKRAKRAKSARRRAAGSLAVARRFAVKQADSLLKRLRGKKRR
ncbi:MAG TPA: VOC family protein [Steroidobacteraceae bacterium]|jgi:predicted enzyme related to lactoylglutathione lyase|nr:VOC family protein [Steroidobacteraceae bacterium]